MGNLAEYRSLVLPALRESLASMVDGEFDPMDRDHVRALRLAAWQQYMLGNLTDPMFKNTLGLVEQLMTDIAYEEDEKRRAKNYKVYQPGPGHLREKVREAKAAITTWSTPPIPDPPTHTLPIDIDDQEE